MLQSSTSSHNEKARSISIQTQVKLIPEFKMQPVFLLPLSPTFTFAQDSRKQLKMDLKVNLKMEDENLRNEAVMEQKQVNGGDEDEGREEDEFSFVCENQHAMPVYAEDVFDNGRIRSTFPVFNPNLPFTNEYGNVLQGGSSPLSPSLKKFSIQRPEISSHSTSLPSESAKLDRTPKGLELEQSMKAVVEPSLERCEKSNSTRFSKLWRIRDMFRRSKNDRKDTVVILNPSTRSSSMEFEKVEVKPQKSKTGKGENIVVGKGKASKGAKRKTAPSVHEKYYMMNRAKKEDDKRRSYLPYKVGFFTNVNRKQKHPSFSSSEHIKLLKYFGTVI